MCARQITGLCSSPFTEIHVKCPTCREFNPRPERETNAYSINMPLLRAIDLFMTSECQCFKAYFGIDLEPITCHLCDMKFGSLSDLHHHMNGDEVINKCPKSQVECITCLKFIERDKIQFNTCPMCDNKIYYIN